MKSPHGVSCDVCSAPRSEAGASQWRMLMISIFRSMSVMGIYGWDDKMTDTADARHSCSNGCTQILVDRYLTTGTFEKPQFIEKPKAAAAVAEPAGGAA
jgi:hypothetical protein